jgi:type II secretory pathway pseudopilin PulG
MKQRGFVLIELIVVFGMIAVLLGFFVINVFGSQRKATLTATIQTLMADVKTQQNKAMTQTTTSGSVPSGYGIRFETSRYILFRGLTYNSADSTNSIIQLDPRVQISPISLPGESIVFETKSGELSGFSPSLQSISVNQLDSGEVKVIQFNRYGIITSVN